MFLPDIDVSKVSGALGQIAEAPGDLAEAYFERLEEIELPPEGESLGLRMRREEGLAVRLVRGGHVWLASRDGLAAERFSHALRQVARTTPVAPLPVPSLEAEPWHEAPNATELLSFPSQVHHNLRDQPDTLRFRLTVRRHRRGLQVVGRHLVPEAEQERFYSCVVELPWDTYGALLSDLGDEAAEQVASSLVERQRARHCAPPLPQRGVVVLAPAAAAVLLHEAVAHALEADSLALSGDPQAAVGLRMGAKFLHLLDDPSGAPQGVQRRTDDEGVPVLRRWLLRGGIIEQPLADSRWASGSDVLVPGAARRSTRHLPPVPRSSHLELLPGEIPDDELFAEADGGLFIPEASRGNLDPMTGVFSLQIPCARRIGDGEPQESVGPFLLQGRVRDLLDSIITVGNVSRRAGAGWCAKGGQKLPVWATTPPVRLEGVEVKT